MNARQEWIDSHPDPDWEKTSGERKNNTLIEMKIEGLTSTDS